MKALRIIVVHYNHPMKCQKVIEEGDHKPKIFLLKQFNLSSFTEG